jgi:electron transfer flavoprotein alpha subunit
MKTIVFAELANGSYKKTSLEAITYASKIAGVAEVHVLAIGEASSAELAKAGQYGGNQVWHSANGLQNSMAAASILSAAISATGASVIIAPKSAFADAVTARSAAKAKAAVVGNVVALPETSNGFSVKRSIFTGKAFAQTTVSSDIKFLSIKKSCVEAEISGSDCKVEALSVDVSAQIAQATITDTLKASGTLSLPEADLVISGGRGMKGPETWQPLLDLAEALGAATACSKPVSDLDWRPHHEHVGQTGVKVAPNLYIACGISGAIQHLAGVNSSKVIVVINKDPEAPFFKAADYGIVGDVFEVLPKLTAAVKAM